MLNKLCCLLMAEYKVIEYKFNLAINLLRPSDAYIRR